MLLAGLPVLMKTEGLYPNLLKGCDIQLFRNADVCQPEQTSSLRYERLLGGLLGGGDSIALVKPERDSGHTEFARGEVSW